MAAIKAVELVAVCFEDFRLPYQKGGDCLGLERYQTLTKNPNHYNNRRVTECGCFCQILQEFKM